MHVDTHTAEHERLREERERHRNWKRWGTYLPERQWATVREDYSANHNVWGDFNYDAARSRAFRWGEDGLLGWCDRECRLCFSIALWNGNDPHLKERLFGLSNPQGNHGEDVKELYYYLDATPTHSYCKALYKYPHAAFPYEALVRENARRSTDEREYELVDTGVFDDSRYTDVQVEYAKGGANDILIKLTVTNRGPQTHELHLIPQLLFRNSWSWGCTHDGCDPKPHMKATSDREIRMSHDTLGSWIYQIEPASDGTIGELVFTENETNTLAMYGVGERGFSKDAFHRYIVAGEADAIDPKRQGTKSAAIYQLSLDAGECKTVRLRLFAEEETPVKAFGDFDRILKERSREADAFYDHVLSKGLTDDQRRISRQAYAGLLWTKQFYHYVVDAWIKGDPNQPPPPAARKENIPNCSWRHLFARDVLSMPDKWEYPWFAAWDSAFHMVPMSRIDPDYAKEQLLLFLREWYMHPSGQIPAYEFAFDDVNPPIHALAAWRVYKMSGPRGKRDVGFLARIFQKLLLNFTWWVNTKGASAEHIFGGGFLGMDNISVIDRNMKLPPGTRLVQADGTGWMAVFCIVMLSMALELAENDPVYEDLASKFFEHFVAIVDAVNVKGADGLWNEDDNFYYDQFRTKDGVEPVRVRTVSGLIPLLATVTLEPNVIEKLPGFKKRMDWFIEHRPQLAEHLNFGEAVDGQRADSIMLSVIDRKKLEKLLEYIFCEEEFLSDYGIRSLSKHYRDHPLHQSLDGQTLQVKYEPAESESRSFGGNSNWRGPIWMPINWLIAEALERYHFFVGDGFKIELPTGSGNLVTLKEAARELQRRNGLIFEKNATGHRPVHGDCSHYATDPAFRELVLFYEYFHGENGAGLGASHQTGWTSLITQCFEALASDKTPEKK